MCIIKIFNDGRLKKILLLITIRVVRIRAIKLFN